MSTADPWDWYDTTAWESRDDAHRVRFEPTQPSPSDLTFPEPMEQP